MAIIAWRRSLLRSPYLAATILALAAICLFPTTAAAQSNAITIDHATGKVWDCTVKDFKNSKEKCKEIFKEGVVYVKQKKDVNVTVVNTNTALYTYTFSTETVADPTADTLRSFLSTAAPYALDFITGGKVSITGGKDSITGGKDSSLHSPDGGVENTLPEEEKNK